MQSSGIFWSCQNYQANTVAFCAPSKKPDTVRKAYCLLAVFQAFGKWLYLYSHMIYWLGIMVM